MFGTTLLSGLTIFETKGKTRGDAAQLHLLAKRGYGVPVVNGRLTVSVFEGPWSQAGGEARRAKAIARTSDCHYSERM